MEWQRAQRFLAGGSLTRAIRPARPPKPVRFGLLGFDTEHTRGGRLLCWQLSNGIESKLYTGRLTIRALISAAREGFGIQEDLIVLATYWSPAELRFLRVAEDSTRLFTGARGSLDAEFLCLDVRVLVYDVSRWYPGESLASAAAMLGGRQKLTYDVSRLSPRSLNDPRFRAYALRDAELAHDLFCCASARMGGDPLADKTLGNLASRAYRSKLTTPIPPPDPRVRVLALRACWGGRAEAYWRGNTLTDAVCWDFAAAYPTAAASAPLPLPEEWRQARSLGDLLLAEGGFARVEFRFPTGTRYPCLPVGREGYLLFPLRGESFATVDEIRLADSAGAKMYLREGWCYDEGRSDFHGFVRDLINNRTNATSDAARRWWKYVANAIVGKLAQGVEDVSVEDLRRVAREWNVPMADVAKLNPISAEALGVYRRLSLGSIHAPEWQAIITGRVRARLGSLVMRLADAGAAVLSVNTDSVVFLENPACAPLRAEDFDAGAREYARGPAIIARTRLELVGEHVASHGWQSASAARAALEEFGASGRDVALSYDVERPVTFRESLLTGRPFGRFLERHLRGDTRWCGKRRPPEAGDWLAEPWETAGDFLAWKAANEIGRRPPKPARFGRNETLGPLLP